MALSERNKTGLDEAVETGVAAGGEATGVVCDLTDALEIVRAGEEVTDGLGGIDIMVNNADVSAARPVRRTRRRRARPGVWSAPGRSD